MTATQHLNQSVYCKLAPSSIHGIGVFAIRDIPQGTTFDACEYMICAVAEEDFKNLLPEIQELITDKNVFLERDKIFHFIHPNGVQHLQSFMNHSNFANTDGHKALRDIKAGEELTENYHTLVPHEQHRISRARNLTLK